MPNIGDRLEEARKRQGISIREASEATKVRGDILLSLENNNFDFDLPDVYKRGFLKLYARYLKLDTDKLMTDFDAAMLGRSKVKRGDAREFFGRMDLPERNTPLGSKESSPPFGEHPSHEERSRAAAAAASAAGAASSARPAEAMEQQADTSLYWKIGGIFVGTFVIVGLLALLVQSVFSSSDDDVSTPPAAVASGGTTSSGAATADDTRPMKVTLIGLGDTNVIVKQASDDKKIEAASGFLETGQEVAFTSNGPVMIASPNIENIAVRINGREYKPGVSGLYRWFVNEQGPYTPR